MRAVRAELGDIILERLKRLPTHFRLPLEDGKELLLVHGAPADPRRRAHPRHDGRGSQRPDRRRSCRCRRLWHEPRPVRQDGRRRAHHQRRQRRRSAVARGPQRRPRDVDRLDARAASSSSRSPSPSAPPSSASCRSVDDDRTRVDRLTNDSRGSSYEGLYRFWRGSERRRTLRGPLAEVSRRVGPSSTSPNRRRGSRPDPSARRCAASRAACRRGRA